MYRQLKTGGLVKKEEKSLEWIRHVRKKMSKELLNLPNNKERVQYIKNKARVLRTNITTLKARKRKAS